MFLVKLLKLADKFLYLWEVYILKQTTESQDFCVFQYFVHCLSNFMEITYAEIFKWIKCMVVRDCPLMDSVAVLRNCFPRDELCISSRTATETEK